MARIFIDSFETQDLNIWDSTSGASIISTDGLDLKGNYCVYLSNNSRFIEKKLSAKNEYYFSFLIRFLNISNIYFRFYNNGSELVRAQFSDNRLRWLVKGSWYGYYDSTIIYQANITYFMQIYIKMSTTNGRIYVKANGVVDRNSIHDMSVSSPINKVEFIGPAYYDNIVIDDSVMPEETEIIVLRPNGQGIFSECNTSSSGYNYNFINEVPYDDSTFVSSGIINAIDTYTFENLPVDAAKSVKCVQLQVRARKDSDTTLSGINFIIHKGTKNYYSDFVYLSNDFNTYLDVYTYGPTNSGFWYAPDMNLMEIGIKIGI